MVQDDFWGDGGDQGKGVKGKNHLGLNLMKVRAKLTSLNKIEAKMGQLAIAESQNP